MRSQALLSMGMVVATVAGEDLFRWVFAPTILIVILCFASVAEAWTEYRCCGHEEQFDFKEITKDKLELMALCVSAMCLDAVMWILSQLVPEKFPFLGQITIPFVTIIWTSWMIAAETSRTRKNVKKSRGSDYSPPLIGGIFEFVDRLKAADRDKVGHTHHPRRRTTDKIIAEVESSKERSDGKV